VLVRLSAWRRGISSTLPLQIMLHLQYASCRPAGVAQGHRLPWPPAIDRL